MEDRASVANYAASNLAKMRNQRRSRKRISSPLASSAVRGCSFFVAD